jgi:site-specific DNA-methyltransferase (adenine-specific)
MNLHELYNVADCKCLKGMLFNDDCFKLMKKIDDKSIDCIICDLPYGKKTGFKWDVSLTFDNLWNEYLRIIKDDGAIVLFAVEPFTSKLILSQEKLFRYKWTWEKEQGGNFQLAKLQPLNITEDICIFSKAKTANGAKLNMKYYPIMTIRDTPTKSGGNPSVSKILNDNNMIALHKEYTTAYPKSILKYNKVHSSKRLHPTEKPLDLCEYLIKTYTLENEIVLDNCMGSGTTCHACINTNRRYIGCELDENYFNVAKERIINAENFTKGE